GSTYICRPRGKFLDFHRNAVSAHDHGALGDGEVVGEDGDLVVLGGIELDDGTAAEPQDLMDRHGGGAEHHLDVEGDLLELGHGQRFLRRADTTIPGALVAVRKPAAGPGTGPERAFSRTCTKSPRYGYE